MQGTVCVAARAGLVSELVGGVGVTDSFSCPHCAEKFMPATFPFKYKYDAGAMGLGSETTYVLDALCPKCQKHFSPGFFTTSKICRKGAAKTSRAELVITDGWSQYGQELYH
jgi:hypothetical protein